MSKRLLTLAFFAVLSVGASAWIARSAQAGPPLCPNGNVDPGEQCDDNNTVNGDGCSANCLNEVCGDGVTNPLNNEQCDDGNTIAGDGCENDCTLTPTNPLTPAQQKCVNAVNKAVGGVVKGVNSDNTSCAKAIASGKDPGTCLGTDSTGKVANAQAKVTSTFTGKTCTTKLPDPPGAPGFAFTDATTANAAPPAQIGAGLVTVFGLPPVLATNATDKPGADCQAEVLKNFNAIAGKYISAALKAKKTALKGGKGNPPSPAPAASPAELGTAIDAAVAADTALAKAESKANTNIAKKCTDAQVDPLFDCGGATTANGLTLCTIAAAKEAACTSFEMADAIPLTCPSEMVP